MIETRPRSAQLSADALQLLSHQAGRPAVRAARSAVARPGHWPHCEPAAAVWMGELVCLCRVADPTTGQH